MNMHARVLLIACVACRFHNLHERMRSGAHAQPSDHGLRAIRARDPLMLGRAVLFFGFG